MTEFIALNPTDVFSNCRAITFDVGGTLIEPYPSVGEVYSQVAKRFGIVADPQILSRCFSAAWKARATFDYSLEAWSELVRASFRDFGPVSEECFRSIYDAFARPSAWRIFPDVLPTLESLRAAGVRLGIISNWDERLRPLLRALGLSDYFEQIVISHEVGHPKPKPQIFLAAAQDLRIPVNQILHIGDGRTEDYQGALAVGFNASLLSRSQPDEHKATIRSLAELWPKKS